MWSLVENDSFVFVRYGDGKQSAVVQTVTPAAKLWIVEVTFVQGEPKHLSLKDFDNSTSSFSRQFQKTSLQSRGVFCQLFKEMVIKLRSESFIDEDDRSADTTSEAPETGGDIVEADYSPEKDPANGLQGMEQKADDYLYEKKMLEKSVKVHLLNLIEPEEAKRIRPVDMAHARELEESFLKAPGGEFHLMAGHIIRGDVHKADKNGGATIEVLVGNHTRTALTSLYRRGLRHEWVFVTIYQKLLTEEALKVGLHHNAIGGKQKPMTFVDTVNVVRRVKDTTCLASIFGYEERVRQLEEEKNEWKKTVESSSCKTCTLRTTEPTMKRQRTSEKTKEVFTTGEKVFSFYKPERKWYPAFIKDIRCNGFFVEYEEDGVVETVKSSAVKKL